MANENVSSEINTIIKRRKRQTSKTDVERVWHAPLRRNFNIIDSQVNSVSGLLESSPREVLKSSSTHKALANTTSNPYY